MESVLRRLEKSNSFDIIRFEEEMILNDHPDTWPVVECLIGFVSTGFPLDKALQYVERVRPIEVNPLKNQGVLRNRHEVYQRLREWNVPCPDFVVVDHAKCAPTGPAIFQEFDNYIVYNGRRLDKPVVEKPLDGDDHNIWIHYPRNKGGGCKKLFRKVGDRSADYDPDINTVRRDKAYIYEPYMATGGTDVKVYTVGETYFHAEARKAPTVDGKVKRSKDGKETRYPIILAEFEKMFAAVVEEILRFFASFFDFLRP
jgi:hypothetical protein